MHVYPYFLRAFGARIPLFYLRKSTYTPPTFSRAFGARIPLFYPWESTYTPIFCAPSEHVYPYFTPGNPRIPLFFRVSDSTYTPIAYTPPQTPRIPLPRIPLLARFSIPLPKTRVYPCCVYPPPFLDTTYTPPRIPPAKCNPRIPLIAYTPRQL